MAIKIGGDTVIDNSKNLSVSNLSTNADGVVGTGYIKTVGLSVGWATQ